VLKKAALPTAAADAGFLATYLFLFSGDPTSGTTNDSLFYFGGMTNITWWKEDLIIALRSVGVPGPVRLLCILAVFAIFFFTIYLLPFTIGYIREFILVVTKKHEFDFARITVYAAALVGFVLMMFLSYDGHSQVYFGTATTAFVPLISFWFFEDREEITSGAVKVLFRVCCVWFFDPCRLGCDRGVISNVFVGFDYKHIVFLRIGIISSYGSAAYRYCDYSLVDIIFRKGQQKILELAGVVHDFEFDVISCPDSICNPCARFCETF
jgi:hypothetical protein